MIEGTLERLVASWHPSGGLNRWRNKNGFTILDWHYSADPDKTQEWAREAAKLYPGGMTGAQWRAEMEKDWLARSGGRVFEDFTLATHTIRPFAIPDNWHVYRAIDWGYRNPTACVWVAVDGDGELYVFLEHYGSRMTVAEHASKIKALTGRRKVQFTLIDPSAFAQTNPSAKAIAAQFAMDGIAVNPGDNRVLDGILEVAELFKLREDGSPRLRIFENCPKLIAELLGYRWQAASQGGLNERDPREAPVKRNDHGVDALRYLVMGLPRNYATAAQRATKLPRPPTIQEEIQRQILMRRLGGHGLADLEEQF